MIEYDAIIAGYTCVDLIPDFKKQTAINSISDFFKPGKLIEIGGMDFVLGGVVPNTGLAMDKFGKKVYLNGLIGNDSIGKIAELQLKEHGVFEGIVKIAEADTAFSIVIAPMGIDRIFLESPGCNQSFNIKHINFEMVSKTRLFHFGYPPLLKQFFLNDGQQLVQMYSKVQRAGAVTSLDFSLPDQESESGKIDWPLILKNTLPFVDIFTPSIEELLLTMMPSKYAEIESQKKEGEIIDKIPISLVQEIGNIIISSGVNILLIKMGHRGAYLLTKDTSSINKKLGLVLENKKWSNCEIFCKAYKVDNSRVKHASGAGDIAVAAFLSSILNGENPDMAIKYSAMAGKESLYCENNFNNMLNWEQLGDKIDKETNELILY